MHYDRTVVAVVLLMALWTVPVAGGLWDDIFGFLGGGGGEIVGDSTPGGIGTIELDGSRPVTVESSGYFSAWESGTINGSQLTFNFDVLKIGVNLRGADQTWTKTGSGNYVKYSSTNIDIEYFVHDGYVKQNVTLKKKPFPSLSIDLTNQSGWLWLNDGSNVTLYDDLGIPKLSIGVPYAVDGDGTQLYPGIRVDSNNRVFFVNGSDIISAKAPVLIDPLYAISSSTGSDGLSYTTQRHFARTNNGTRWVAWKGSSGQILSAWSVNDGVTWTTSTVDTASTLNVPMSIVTDSQGGVYLFVRARFSGDSYDRIYLYYRNATSTWTSRKVLTPNTDPHVHPAACVNSSDYIYLMWSAQGRGADYTFNYNLQWGVMPPGPSRAFVDKGEVEDRAGEQYNPTCVIDASDNLYTTWYGASWGSYSAQNSRVAKKYTLSTNSWAATEVLYNVESYNQYEGGAGVNQSGFVYDVWRGKGFGSNPSYYGIYHRVRNPSGGTWSTQVQLDNDDTYHDSTPNVGFDLGDNVTFAWMGTGMGPSTSSYNILMRNLTISTNTLGARTIITGTGKATSRSDYEPNLHNDYWPLCQKRPALGWEFVYTNQTGASTYQITYFNSTNLAWTACPSAPTAAFSCTPTTGTIKYDTTCTDTSTGPPTSWYWEVTNSTGTKLTSTVQNPIFNLTFADSYSVNMQATNGYGSDWENKSAYLTASNSVTAAFNVTPTWGNQSQLFDFVGNGTAINQSYWDWDLDDGNTTHTQNVSDKRYPCDSGASGWVGSGMCQYDPTYKVYDSYGTPWVASHQVDFWMQIYGYNLTVYQNATPTVTFVANVTSGTQPLAVKFTPTVADAIKVDSWSWDLGDSNTSTLQSPENVYWDGTYSISVTATNYTLGVTTVTRTNYITVTAGAAPIVTFTCTPRATIPNGSVACTYTGGAATTYDWYSTTSGGQQALFSGNVTTQNPTFFPKKPGGYFSIDLIACNGALCNSTTSGPRYIWVQKYSHSWWGGW